MTDFVDSERSINISFHSLSTANPNVFNFYVYLRTHPLLIRQYLASTAQDKKKTHVVLSGFTYGTDSSTSNPDRQVCVGISLLHFVMVSFIKLTLKSHNNC